MEDEGLRGTRPAEKGIRLSNAPCFTAEFRDALDS